MAGLSASCISCKSHKTSEIVGWIVGWKIFREEGIIAAPRGPTPNPFQGKADNTTGPLAMLSSGRETGIVRQSLQRSGKTRETVLFQLVGSQGLSIGISSF
jgi:hypothetical protein